MQAGTSRVLHSMLINIYSYRYIYMPRTSDKKQESKEGGKKFLKKKETRKEDFY